MPAQANSSKRVGFLGTLWRVVRQFFHESIGAMFLVLALFWSVAALRQWLHGSATWSWAALGGFGLMFAGFGVSSFRSARRVR
jgi:hypothetical protein